MKIIRYISGKIIHISILVFVLFAAVSADVLTLDQSIDLALKNNFGVIAARNSYSSAGGNVYGAWGKFIPTISLSANRNQSWTNPFADTSRTPIFLDTTLVGYITQPRSGGGKSTSYSGSLSFSQRYSGLGIGTYANLKQAYHVRSSSLYSYYSAQTSLIQSVKNAYYAALRSRMLVAVDSDAVKRSDERLRVTQSRYDLGSAAMSDVLRAKVQLATDQLSLVSDANAYQSGLINLAFIIGIPVTETFDIAEKLPEAETNVTFESALSEALVQNPDYKKAQFDLYSSKDFALAAYANNLPSLSLSLTHSTSAAKFSQLTDFKAANANYTFSVGLGFNIFNGFSDYASVRTARNNVNTANENLKNTKNGVALAVQQAFLDIQRAKEERSLSDQSVASAQEDYNLVKEKYDLGAAAILDLLDAEVALKQAQISQVNALFDYNIAVANLDKAMGK
jgi:outer membrane protein TolC